MGTIQNIADRFWMMIGKTEKVYPVEVEKHRVKGDTLVYDGKDRGRTLVDDEGRKNFELLNEPYAEGLVKYEDFLDTKDGNRVALAMIDRDKFVPLQRKYDFSKDTYLDLDEDEIKNPENIEVEENALEYVLGVSTFLEWAEQDWQDTSRIVETQNEKWWEQEKFQAAMLFVGAGLFFIFIGFALGETFLKDVAERLAENTEALNQLRNEFGQQIGGNQ